MICLRFAILFLPFFKLWKTTGHSKWPAIQSSRFSFVLTLVFHSLQIPDVDNVSYNYYAKQDIPIPVETRGQLNFVKPVF